MERAAVVIGAGIIGTLTGYRLARAGWRVTVLEGMHVGAGSSSRTAAGIRQQFSTPETVIGMRFSVDFYRRFQELVGGDEAPIVQNGYLFLLEGATEAAAARVEMQRRCGLTEAELLDPDETARRFPFVDGAAITGATWCPTDGFLHPAVVYNEAAEALRRLGGQVVQNAPVLESRSQGGRLQEVLAGGAWRGADLFVDATNAWTLRTGRVLGATPLLVVPLKRYLWFLERAGPMTEAELLAMPLVITPGGAYCRPENGASLLSGFAHDAAAEPDFSYEDQDRIDAEFSHRSGPESQAFATWMELAEHLPPIGEFAGVTATTSGFYGVTPDHNPFLGYDPALPNLLRMVGYSGHGAMFGPFAAEVGLRLAEAGRDLPSVDVLGRAVSLAPFSVGRSFTAREALVI